MGNSQTKTDRQLIAVNKQSLFPLKPLMAALCSRPHLTTPSGLDKRRGFGIERETERKAFKAAHINAAG